MNSFIALLRRIFLVSAGGFYAFVAYEIGILILAWMGKVGPDWLIGIALLIHLMVALGLFLNLAPILGVSIAGYISGAAPQTADTAGQGSSGAVTWYIRATQGISHAVTLLILSLFLFDYNFSLGMFLFIGILLMVWGQYALVFPGQSPWPQRISTAILLVVTLGAVAVSLSPDVAKFLTGRPFWSGAVYKDAAMAEKNQAKNLEIRQRAAMARVNELIRFHKIETGEDWKFSKLVAAGQLTQWEVDTYLAIRDGKYNTLPGFVVNGVPAATAAAPGLVNQPWFWPVVGVAGFLLLVWLVAKGGGIKLSGGWIALILILVLVVALFQHSSREWIMGAVTGTWQTQVQGKVVIPYNMTSLGVKATSQCLPQGTWKYEGVTSDSPYYQIRLPGGGIGTGYFMLGSGYASDKGMVASLPVPNPSAVGMLVISSGNSKNVAVGRTLLTTSCESLMVQENIPPDWSRGNLLNKGEVKLIFARE